jgi:hypothetical protein
LDSEGVVSFGDEVVILNQLYVGGAVLAYVDSDTINVRRLEDDSLRMEQARVSIAKGTSLELPGGV